MTVRSEFVRLLDPVVDGRLYSDVVARGGLAYPYIGVLDHLSEVPATKGDGRTTARRRTIQVDLWQLAEDEDPALLAAVDDALDGVRISGAYAVAVTSSNRVYDPDPKVVHHAITCSVARPR